MDPEPPSSPFPSSPRVVYQKNPLVQVICQLRFPTILEIGSRDPADFQEELRSTYPLYAREEFGGLPKEIAEAVARSALAGAIGEITHKFLTEDEKRFISLAREFIAISESAYSIWGNFRREVIVAKTALEKVHRPAFYSRIGLRYQDVVDKDGLGLGAEPWDALINSPLVGLLAEEGTKDYVRGIAGEVLISVDDGVKGGFVRLRHGLTAHDGRQVYAIDADFFTEEKNGSEDVLGVLDKFNKLAGCLFRWAITPRLHRALAPVAAE